MSFSYTHLDIENGDTGLQARTIINGKFDEVRIFLDALNISNPVGSEGDLQMKSGSNLGASAINDNGTRLRIIDRADGIVFESTTITNSTNKIFFNGDSQTEILNHTGIKLALNGHDLLMSGSSIAPSVDLTLGNINNFWKESYIKSIMMDNLGAKIWMENANEIKVTSPLFKVDVATSFTVDGFTEINGNLSVLGQLSMWNGDFTITEGVSKTEIASLNEIDITAPIFTVTASTNSVFNGLVKFNGATEFRENLQVFNGKQLIFTTTGGIDTGYLRADDTNDTLLMGSTGDIYIKGDNLYLEPLSNLYVGTESWFTDFVNFQANVFVDGAEIRLYSDSKLRLLDDAQVRSMAEIYYNGVAGNEHGRFALYNYDGVTHFQYLDITKSGNDAVINGWDHALNFASNVGAFFSAEATFNADVFMDNNLQDAGTDHPVIVVDPTTKKLYTRPIGGSSGLTPAGNDGDLQMKSGSALAGSGINDDGSTITSSRVFEVNDGTHFIRLGSNTWMGDITTSRTQFRFVPENGVTSVMIMDGSALRQETYSSMTLGQADTPWVSLYLSDLGSGVVFTDHSTQTVRGSILGDTSGILQLTGTSHINLNSNTKTSSFIDSLASSFRVRDAGDTQTLLEITNSGNQGLMNLGDFSVTNTLGAGTRSFDISFNDIASGFDDGVLKLIGIQKTIVPEDHSITGTGLGSISFASDTTWLNAPGFQAFMGIERTDTRIVTRTQFNVSVSTDDLNNPLNWLHMKADEIILNRYSGNALGGGTFLNGIRITDQLLEINGASFVVNSNYTQVNEDLKMSTNGGANVLWRVFNTGTSYDMDFYTSSEATPIMSFNYASTFNRIITHANAGLDLQLGTPGLRISSGISDTVSDLKALVIDEADGQIYKKSISVAGVPKYDEWEYVRDGAISYLSGSKTLTKRSVSSNDMGFDIPETGVTKLKWIEIKLHEGYNNTASNINIKFHEWDNSDLSLVTALLRGFGAGTLIHSQSALTTSGSYASRNYIKERIDGLDITLPAGKQVFCDIDLGTSEWVMEDVTVRIGIEHT